MHSNVPGLIRLPVFGLVLLFSLIVLGLDAHLDDKLSGSITEFGVKYSWSAPHWTKLGIAIAVITIVTLLPMLIIDFLRKGAPTSWVLTELVWFSILWVLWLATAADAADKIDCSSGDLCSDAKAAEAFSWLNWILIMGYAGVLAVWAVIGHRRGNTGVWRSGVRDTDFMAGGSSSTAPTAPMAQHNVV